MALIRLSITISDIIGSMASYDQIKIYRSVDGAGGTYTELTTSSDRINLKTVVQSYDYIDIVGLSTFYYKYSLFNSTTLAEGSQSSEFQGTEINGLYCTLQQIRDEGLDESIFPDATDDRINEKIEWASREIERVTNRYFEPRYKQISMNGKNSQAIMIGLPIIRIDSMSIDDDDQDLDDFTIYNRHLTRSLYRPDDRAAPKIAWSDEDIDLAGTSYQSGTRLKSKFKPFTRGRLNVVVSGLFGYTTLGPSAPVGETADGSQKPINYGSTPGDITQACIRLVMREWPLLTETDDLRDWRDSWRLESIKTRDQTVKWTPLSKAGDGIGSLTGDANIDRLLAAYVAPKSMVGVV